MPFPILKRVLPALIFIPVLFLISSPLSLTLWQLTPDGFTKAGWQTGVPDKKAVEAYPTASLDWNNGNVVIVSPQGRWQNPAVWNVQQAQWTDLNHDGQSEVTLLVRRPFAPWPVDKLLPFGGRIQSYQDAAGQSSHIILIGWKKDHWGELWAGSALARPVRSFEAVDLDQDGDQELLVREGDYQDTDTSSASTLALWKWNGFGFDLITRMERPSVHFNLIMSKDKKNLILVE
ncbi:MAG: hypothetical protein GYA15_01970 [Leptolinea sp.]|nr:hypothetical protein [Leptolinea sp.]